MKKIDIHCHTTNRKLKDILQADASINTILKEMQKHEIEKTVLLATYFPHKQSGISNFRLLHWINKANNEYEQNEQNKKFYMFGSLDFDHFFNQGINELEEMAENSLIKGIKIYTCYQKIDLKSEKMKKIVGVAKNFSLPVAFHCGYSYSSMRDYGTPSIEKTVEPSDLEFLAKENPEVNMIFSHMGKPFFEDMISVAKENPNIYSDVSGLIDSKYDQEEIPEDIEYIKKFVHECGPSKLLFGTDFPVQTHEDSVNFVEESMKPFSEREKQAVYYDNAKRLLRL